MKNNRVNAQKIVVCAVLAALYAVLTLLLAPISYGAFQCRVSEALTLLPFFAPYTMWGLFIGCFLANLYTGSVLDIVFGSLATLLAAFLTSKCKNKWLAALPPVLVNAVVVGAVIAWSSAGPEAFWPAFAVNAFWVGLGQLGACYVLGTVLVTALERLELKGLFTGKNGK